MDKLIQLVKYSRWNEDELRTQIGDLISEYDIKPWCNTDHPDIKEKVKIFVTAKRLEGLSEKTLDGYIRELRNISKQIQKPVINVTTGDIRVYLSQFHKLKKSTLGRKISILRSFFGWLFKEEYIAKNPMTKINRPKTEKRLPKALTVEELEMVREACVSNRERALIELFYATGCRLSEVVGLDIDDIDWNSESTSVIGKGDKQRVVYLSCKAMYHLRKYLKERNDQEKALIITERMPYRRLSNRAVQRAFKKIADRAGIKKKLHPHVMRHTLATMLLNNGAPLSAVQAILGHENPSTTQIYAQLSPEKSRIAYKQYHVI